MFFERGRAVLGGIVSAVLLFMFVSSVQASSCSWSSSKCVNLGDSVTHGAFCDIYDCYCGPAFIVTPTMSVDRCRQPAWICSLGAQCCPYLLYDETHEWDDLTITSFKAIPDTPASSTDASIAFTGEIKELAGKAIYWTLSVAGRSFPGAGASVNILWDGKDGAGTKVPKGDYTASLNARIKEASCADSKSIKVTIDWQACDLEISTLAGSDKLIANSGGSIAINGSVTDSSGQPVSWTLAVLDKIYSGSGKSVDVTWDGKYANGTVVESGEYSATLTAQTADGQCKNSKTVNFTVSPAPDGQCGLYVQFGSQAHLASGNLAHSQELFSARGGVMPAGVTLSYNSLDPRNGSLGRGWSHSYDYILKENANGSVLITAPNWEYDYFTLANGAYAGQPGNYATLVKNPDGTFTLTRKDGQVSTFANGKIAAIADRNGNTTTFAYSGANLAMVTDPAGRTVTFNYDSANHLTAITDPAGTVYSLAVGASLNAVTQPDGGTWRYTYDANGFMQNKTDPLGNVTGYAYDDQHRVVSATDPQGGMRSIAYPQSTDSVKSTTFTEKDGGQWCYSYDTLNGYLLSKTDPQGGTTAYGYDANGNRTATTNPDGTSTSASYDSTGNMLTATDALGQTTGYAYNAFGQVTGITDPQGGATAYAYDTKGNLTALTDPTGATTTYAYDAKGNITKVTDSAGLATSFTYDGKGNLATVTDASGAATSYTYDAAGNMTSSTDAKGAVTQFIYDNRNRLIKTIDPLGNATLYSYDANGNKLSETDANGNTTKYEYNGKNQLIKTIDALGNATTYAYGGSSCPSCGGGNGEKLTTLTDANGNSTSYLYDQLGRLSKETDPKGDVTSYVYDAKGNLASKADANGATISYSYDANGRLLKKRYPDNTEETFTYDPKGNILSATNKDIAYNFTYDAAGRMISSMDSNSRYLQYSYDNTGRKTKTIYPEGSVVSYAYDSAGRLASITNGGGRTYGYSYDKLGRRTKLAYPNGATANYSYDTAGRLTNLEHKQSNGRIIASLAYTHDKVGNRLTKAEPEITWTYGYDAIYRLLQAVPAKPHHDDDDWKKGGEAYSYDPTGNRLTGPDRHTAYTYGPGNEVLTGLKLAYTYDRNGNQIEKTRLHQEEHNKGEHRDHDGKKWTYTYDFENRLIKAETKHEDETIVVSFKYDPLGRRIEKKVEKIEHGKIEEVTSNSYVYDGQNILLEYATEKDDDHQQKTQTTKYVHGPGTDEPLSIQQKGDVYYYHSDALGSVVALTDKKQMVVQTYEYDSFGNIKRHGDKVKNIYTYTGRLWDEEIQLYDYRNRFYDPKLGRFTTKDPSFQLSGNFRIPYLLNNFLYSPQKLSPFQYTANNPVNRVDSSGLAFFAKRALTGMPWIPGLSSNPILNIFNAEVSHEQLFFEDGNSPLNVGFFGDGTLHYDESSFGYNREPGHFDDCIMRKAYKNVPLHKYHLIFPLELKFNCQNWADDVRKEYYRLKNQ